METNIFNEKTDFDWTYISPSHKEINGIWFIQVQFFDYTLDLGIIEVPEYFSTLEECIERAKKITAEETDDWCCEFITDEGYTSISIEILCQEDKFRHLVAHTNLLTPKYECEL